MTIVGYDPEAILAKHLGTVIYSYKRLLSKVALGVIELRPPTRSSLMCGHGSKNEKPINIKSRVHLRSGWVKRPKETENTSII